MANRFDKRKTPGFGEGFASTFAPTASDVLMTTLRDLLARPEREQQMQARGQEMEARTQSMARNRGEEARDVELQPIKVQMEQARLNYYKKLAGSRTAAEMEKENSELFKLAIQKASRNPMWETMSPEEQNLSVNTSFDMLKKSKEYSKGGRDSSTPGLESATRKLNPKTKQWWSFRDGKWQPEQK